MLPISISTDEDRVRISDPILLLDNDCKLSIVGEENTLASFKDKLYFYIMIKYEWRILL